MTLDRERSAASRSRHAAALPAHAAQRSRRPSTGTRCGSGSSACVPHPPGPDRRRASHARRSHREARPVKPSIVPTLDRRRSSRPGSALQQLAGGLFLAKLGGLREGELTIIEGDNAEFGRRSPACDLRATIEVLHPQTYADRRVRRHGGRRRGLHARPVARRRPHGTDPPDIVTGTYAVHGRWRRDRRRAAAAGLLHVLNRNSPTAAAATSPRTTTWTTIQRESQAGWSTGPRMCILEKAGTFLHDLTTASTRTSI